MANSFGDVVLVPFPFTDQSGTKKRPAVVVSSSAYNSARRDLIIMAITIRCAVRSGLRRCWSTTGRPSVSSSLRC